MNDPLVLATGVGAFFALSVFVGTSPRLFTMLTAGYVLILPKLNLVPLPGTTVSLRGEDVLIALLAVKMVLDLLSGSSLPPDLKRVAKWLLFLLPIGLVGIVVGLDDRILESPLVALLFLARRYEYFLLAIAAYLYFRDSEMHRRQIFRLLAATVYLNAVVASAQGVGAVGGFPDGTYVPTNRAMGLAGGPYELAALFIVILPMFVWRLTSGTQRTSGLVGVLAIMTSLWFTQSRVGLISAAFVIVLMLVTASRRSPTVVVAGTFIGALVLSVATSPLVASPTSDSRFSTLHPSRMWEATTHAYQTRDYHLIGERRLESNISDQSYALRIDRWFNFYDGLMKFDPLAGLGPSAGGANVDSNYVRVLIEFGVLGLIVLAFLLVAIGKAVRRFPPGPLHAMAVWGGLGLLLQATFIDVFEASKVAETYWLVFGLGLAAMAHRQATESAAEASEAHSTPASARAS